MTAGAGARSLPPVAARRRRSSWTRSATRPTRWRTAGSASAENLAACELSNLSGCHRSSDAFTLAFDAEVRRKEAAFARVEEDRRHRESATAVRKRLACQLYTDVPQAIADIHRCDLGPVAFAKGSTLKASLGGWTGTDDDAADDG